MNKIDKNKAVLVTGASGYIASWIIKYLLEDGITVHATVRNKANTYKFKHLQDIADQSEGSLEIFEADLLKLNSFANAMKGCELVIHTASPFLVQGVKDARKQLVEPALQGTRNVLHTANETGSVKRVVLTSSVVAIYGDAIDIKNTKDGVFTEEYWNTTSSLKVQPYPYSKTIAEKEAWKIQEQHKKWDLTTINPGFVMGPSLTKRTDSTSINFMRQLVKGQFKMGAPDLYFGIVDVRDVARAHILAGFNTDASGRHIAVAETHNILEMAALLSKNVDDELPLPKKKLPKALLYIFGPLQGFSWKYVNNNIGIPLKFDNSYIKKDLGISFKSVSQTLTDHYKQLKEDQLLG